MGDQTARLEANVGVGRSRLRDPDGARLADRSRSAGGVSEGTTTGDAATEGRTEEEDGTRVVAQRFHDADVHGGERDARSAEGLGSPRARAPGCGG